MGCDIHSFAEVKRDGKWIEIHDKIFSPNDSWGKTSEPFGWRSYDMFGFLAGVRNYSKTPPISERKGIPEDSETLNEITDPPSTYGHEVVNDCDFHSHSYLTLKELLDFDYDKTFTDQRYETHLETTYRKFLGKFFFDEIEVLKTLGEPEDVRVIFWFDN